MSTQVQHKGDNQKSVAKFWRLASSLQTQSETQRLIQIKQGFAAVWVGSLKSAFRLSTPEMAALLGLSTSTIERRQKDKKPLDVVSSERLDRVASIAALAQSVFEDQEAASRWLSTPNEGLGGNAPLAQCETEIGANQVRRILHALEWGGAA